MLKHNFRLFAIIAILVSFANVSFGQETPAPVKDPKTAITDTTIEDTKDAVLDNIPVVSLDENSEQDESSQNLTSQVNAGRNAFINAATYNFTVVRFHIRGYDQDLFSTYMNGMTMENLDNGFTPYALWSGLTDVLHNRQYTPGFQAVNYGYGGLGGTTNIDTRAFKQRKQTSIGYSVSNSTYDNRISLTHSSGWTKKGWAYSVSASRRYADQGYTPGTYYDGGSFYGGIDKRINARHILSLVAFATPTDAGRYSSTLQESRDIVGDNYYNPNWGYQNGKVRNAVVTRTFQPFGILTHDWKISDKSTLVSAGSYTFGSRSTSSLDWYNVPDPRPDYYRYLPSYQDDPAMAQLIREAIQNDVNKRQINWDALYNTNYGNYETVKNVNGDSGNNVSGRRSLYIVGRKVVHTSRFNFNTTYNTTVNSHVNISAGLTFQSHRNHYYEVVDDLLGGDFYVDIDQFAERDFPTNTSIFQNDLNHPNRILHEGDRYGYNYDIVIKKSVAWVQTNVKLRKFNFFISGEHSYTNFYRYGNVRTGLFPTNSQGKSAEQNFYNYSGKAGVTYLLTPHNFLFVNGTYETRAPFYENAFLSPRTRNEVRSDLRSEQISSVEGGYVLIAPTVKFRAVGYYTLFKHGVDLITFYDDLARTYGSYSLNNIGKENMGVELGGELLLTKGLTLTSAAAIGRYRYNTRQNAIVTEDNTSAILANDMVYSKNFYVPSPQQAYNAGLNYRSPKYWWVNASFNYFDQMYLEFSPVRRTVAATDGLTPGSKEWHDVIDQTQLKAQHTLDAYAGYSWLMNKRFRALRKRTFLVFSAGVNNILNNRSIVSGGYEQLRFDFAEKDPQKFSDKRSYAYGINYTVSVALRF